MESVEVSSSSTVRAHPSPLTGAPPLAKVSPAQKKKRGKNQSDYGAIDMCLKPRGGDGFELPPSQGEVATSEALAAVTEQTSPTEEALEVVEQEVAPESLEVAEQEEVVAREAPYIAAPAPNFLSDFTSIVESDITLGTEAIMDEPPVMSAGVL